MHTWVCLCKQECMQVRGQPQLSFLRCPLLREFFCWPRTCQAGLARQSTSLGIHLSLLPSSGITRGHATVPCFWVWGEGGLQIKLRSSCLQSQCWQFLQVLPCGFKNFWEHSSAFGSVFPNRYCLQTCSKILQLWEQPCWDPLFLSRLPHLQLSSFVCVIDPVESTCLISCLDSRIYYHSQGQFNTVSTFSIFSWSRILPHLQWPIPGTCALTSKMFSLQTWNPM